MKTLVEVIEFGDVEDPELYAAEPLHQWEHTEKGQWLKENSYQQLTYTVENNHRTYGSQVRVWAWLKEEALTYYILKWGEPKWRILKT